MPRKGMSDAFFIRAACRPDFRFIPFLIFLFLLLPYFFVFAPTVSFSFLLRPYLFFVFAPTVSFYFASSISFCFCSDRIFFRFCSDRIFFLFLLLPDLFVFTPSLFFDPCYLCHDSCFGPVPAFFCSSLNVMVVLLSVHPEK